MSPILEKIVDGFEDLIKNNDPFLMQIYEKVEKYAIAGSSQKEIQNFLILLKWLCIFL